MAVNKVVYGTTTLVDLTEDTVSPSVLKDGFTAHDKTGEKITGTYKPQSGGGGGGSVSGISYSILTIPKYFVSVSQPAGVISGGTISSVTSE